MLFVVVFRSRYIKFYISYEITTMYIQYINFFVMILKKIVRGLSGTNININIFILIRDIQKDILCQGCTVYHGGRGGKLYLFSIKDRTPNKKLQ